MDRKDFLEIVGGGSLASALSLKGDYEPEEKVIKPGPLTKGDTVGLVSPASIVGGDEEYNDVAKRIKQLGYRVKEGDNARNKHGYFAGTDRQRAADLNAMFADPGVDAIMPFRGGWGANRILEFINYALIKEHPKILVGYSDITSLLLAIFKKTGLITFHGPVAKSIWTEFTIDHFLKAMETRTAYSLDTCSNTFSEDYSPLHTLRKGRASGRLLGGNLSVLTSMIGSEYLPDWKGNILFLEDVGEDVYRVDRMLTQLKLSGVLNEISGLIFGQCTSCDISEPNGFTLRQVLQQHIQPLGIPAFSGALIGHIDNMLTLPVGAKVQMDAERGTITLEKPALAGDKRDL